MKVPAPGSVLKIRGHLEASTAKAVVGGQFSVAGFAVPDHSPPITYLVFVFSENSPHRCCACAAASVVAVVEGRTI